MTILLIEECVMEWNNNGWANALETNAAEFTVVKSSNLNTNCNVQLIF